MGAIDFSLLCRDLHIPFAEEGHHHCHQGWIQTHCPFCGDGSYGWHLGYSIEHGNMNCWRCGKISPEKWLRAILPPGSRSQIPAILKKYAGPKILRIKKKVWKARERDIDPPSGSGEMTQRHINYLVSRAFPPNRLRNEWGLLGTQHLSLEWNWRIIAPIKNSSGRIIAYTGRALSDEKKPRWLLSDAKEMGDNPKSLIYGIEKADPEVGVLIVEGPSDVWRMGPGSVGMIGIDWTIEQANILRAFKRRFIMFDPEKIAQGRAERLAHWLSLFPGDTEIISGLPSDPGSLCQSEADNIMMELGIRKRRSKDD